MGTPVVSRQTGRRWAVVTAVAGTVFIAAGAFWLSFTALADLAARSGIGAGQAWVWPLIVDGIIVVATVAVVALAGQRSAWYPWSLLIVGALVSVMANAIHAVVAADADVPGVLAAAVAAVPPVVLLAITHLTVILTRPLPVPGDAESVEHPASPPEISPAAALVPGTPLAPDGAVDSLAVIGATPPQPPGVVSTGRRERARALRDLGWSNKRIARDLGVHPSTVGRWFSAAHLPDDTGHPAIEEAKD
ncbi:MULTISPECIES: DUF2637 domain-containing protein [unclassified Microbacterium]|uniref:DUF2637 domain-containing protein n=1 Tax=unclassified Microbacterium TaxID=2609290 RepID=UPI000EA9B249|nr:MULTISPECIES: DUF2637 domain-containing protein [unclassified Microbacterium]MBT2483114.1 DUF2637 domain-containing protein [Microbacterium sp. ISL-108]RKN69358.1 DUF2637 domain-containing protein [Microbacterium sp. CGR2]